MFWKIGPWYVGEALEAPGSDGIRPDIGPDTVGCWGSLNPWKVGLLKSGPRDEDGAVAALRWKALKSVDELTN